MINLIKAEDYPIEKLEKTKLFKEDMEKYDIEDLNIETLLFQTGYLTIEEYDKRRRYRLTHLNYEIAQAFS